MNKAEEPQSVHIYGFDESTSVYFRWKFTDFVGKRDIRKGGGTEL